MGKGSAKNNEVKDLKPEDDILEDLDKGSAAPIKTTVVMPEDGTLSLSLSLTCKAQWFWKTADPDTFGLWPP